MKKASCVLIFNEDGNVLAVSRKDDPDAFGLPGGNVEEGESFEAACHRETKEETGYTIKNLKAVFSRVSEGETDYEAVTFLAEIDSDVPRDAINPEETGTIAWVTPETLMQGPFGVYNTKLFEAVGKKD